MHDAAEASCGTCGLQQQIRGEFRFGNALCQQRSKVAIRIHQVVLRLRSKPQCHGQRLLPPTRVIVGDEPSVGDQLLTTIIDDSAREHESISGN